MVPKGSRFSKGGVSGARSRGGGERRGQILLEDTGRHILWSWGICWRNTLLSTSAPGAFCTQTCLFYGAVAPSSEVLVQR